MEETEEIYVPVILRYKPKPYGNNGSWDSIYAKCVEDADGDWCRWEDANWLKYELEKAEAEIEFLKGLVKKNK